jgi:uncharacterized protein YdhG (YjbR/CyaY superfamily)
LTTKKQFPTIEEYVKAYPTNVQSILAQIRQIIRAAAPDATETISYQIPAFKLNGKDLIYFAAWKAHIAMYPVPSGSDAFEKELSPFIGGKGTVRFPLERPIPFNLVEGIVRARLQQIDKK